jgi:DNA polymerase III epsilon subunit-like protein
MTALSIDLETSGLPKPGMIKGSDEYPWFVEVGAILFDLNGVELDIFGSRVRADGRKMQPGAIAVHGMTDWEASRAGISEIAALSVVCGFAAQARYLVGYGVQFDRDVCESTLIKLGKETRMLVRPGLQVVDLRPPATQACKIPSDHESGGYRWPSLGEACERLLGDPPRTGKHRAVEDARRNVRLFVHLQQAGYLDLGSAEQRVA